MEPSIAKTLIDILAERSAAWNSLWTVFYTVGVAIVGIVASGKLLSKNRTAASIIAALGFLIFAVGNYAALNEVRVQRESVVAYVKKNAEENKSPEIATLAEASSPPSVFQLLLYHWSLTLFVVVLIVVMPRFLNAPKE